MAKKDQSDEAEPKRAKLRAHHARLVKRMDDALNAEFREYMVGHAMVVLIEERGTSIVLQYESEYVRL